MYPETPSLRHALTLPPNRYVKFFKRFLEAILLEPFGDYLERLAEKVQRRVITRHTKPNQQGRIALSAGELAFHPDSKAPGILQQFAQDAGQQSLL